MIAKRRALLFSVVFGMLFLGFLIVQGYIQTNQACIADKAFPSDALEYHFIAVNFALANQFPVLGFLKDTAAYHICPTRGSASLLQMLQQNGPVVLLSRPPMYSFLLGLAYKLFGIHVWFTSVFNAALLSLIMVLLPMAGFQLWQKKGLMAGVLIALIYIGLRANYFMGQHNVENMCMLIYIVLFMAGLRLGKPTARPVHYLLVGLAVGFSVLTKGIFILTPVFIVVFLFIQKKGLKQWLYNVGMLSAGVMLIVLPWVIYINTIRVNTIAERTAWAAKVKSQLPDIKADTRDELAANKAAYPLINDFIMKQFYIHYVEETGFIIVTNQIAGGALLLVNNEQCTDGDLHPEWKMIKGAYYNTHHLDKSANARIVHFYMDNPRLFVKIMVAKIANASSVFPLFFLLSAALWALVLLQQLINRRVLNGNYKNANTLVGALLVLILACAFVPVPAVGVLILVGIFTLGLLLMPRAAGENQMIILPALVANLLGVVLVIYGDVRFIAVTNPVSLLVSMYLLYTLICNMRKATRLTSPLL